MNFWRIFLLYPPYRKCCLTLSAAAAEAATGVCDVDKWSQWEANECTRSAPSNPQLTLVGGCRSGEEISVRRLQNYLASEHYFSCAVVLHFLSWHSLNKAEVCVAEMCGLPAVNFLHKALEQDHKFPNDTPLHRIAVVSSSRLINTGIELMTDSRRWSLPL